MALGLFNDPYLTGLEREVGVIVADWVGAQCVRALCSEFILTGCASSHRGTVPVFPSFSSTPFINY
eukprot:1155219-Pelagomonas_calceolata.AAC.3